MNTPSKEYLEALATVNAASAEFQKVKEAYRAQQIGDAEFCAAFAKHKAAQGVFDDALLLELQA